MPANHTPIASDREFTLAQAELMRILRSCELPVIAAPMFLVSSPELAAACSKSGVIGSFPAPNARSVEILDRWLAQVTEELKGSSGAAPWMLNMIVHSSYDRFDQEMELVQRYQPRIVSTALGSPKRVLQQVHEYGGIVMADVTTPALAKKAADAGADALVLVTHGAGGHTGHYHPFALLAEVRRFFKGPIGLAGAISSGHEIRAAQILGADFVVLGTRFIAAHESAARPEYRDLLTTSTLADLVETKAVSGVLANWLKPTLDSAGFTAELLAREQRVDFSGDIAAAPKAWKDVWSAGHGVGAIERINSAAEIVKELKQQYALCLQAERSELSA